MLASRHFIRRAMTGLIDFVRGHRVAIQAGVVAAGVGGPVIFYFVVVENHVGR
ncbi:hypothetical protein D3C71_2138030 [compost metagenome]